MDPPFDRRTTKPKDGVGDNASVVNNYKPASSHRNASSGVHFSMQSLGAPRRFLSSSKIHRVSRTPPMADPSSLYHVDHTFQEVFQLKRGGYADLSAAKISEMMKSKALDNAPTQSLLSVVNGILEESVERRHGEIPHRVACLLRKVVQEIERRIATQADHLRTQNNLFKAREEKFQSRIKVLEALASGTREESEVVSNRVHQLKTEKIKEDDKKKAEEEDRKKKIHVEDVNRLMKVQEQKDKEISRLKQEIKKMKSTYEENEENRKNDNEEDVNRLLKERDQKDMEISRLKREMETMRSTYEENGKNDNEEDVNRLLKERDQKDMEISRLKREMETMRSTYEENRKKANEEAANGFLQEQDQKDMEISRLKQEMERMESTYEEDRKKGNEEDVNRLLKEQDQKNTEISRLKQDMETMRSTYDEDRKKANEEHANKLVTEQNQKNMEISRLKQEMETMKTTYDEDRKKAIGEDVKRLMKELDQQNMELSRLKQEMETMKSTYDLRCSQLEAEAKGYKLELEEKSQEMETMKSSYEHLLKDLRNKVKQIEASSESNYQKWKMKENQVHNSLDFQLSTLQKLKLSWESIKQDAMQEKRVYSEECNKLGLSLKSLVKAAESHHVVLAENRKLFNEIQELKGNIRVYCRVRPFLPGQKEKKSIVEHFGEIDLVVANPAKQGKDALRSFKFNKIFGPASTQGDVYSDIQPFIRSVLDGFNVCIFAYGQTGSGKTYTMSGPNGATPETYGVNFRALNDLFSISEGRTSSIVYEIGVQIVEIYNEQGLAVPDASMFPVKSTSDVMDLMDIGLKNRASSATAMNERSSRSHSVVSIHVRGTDVKSGSSLYGNLHLVDLAGSERVDRSEVTGDRLKEAQHINKSLSALGDVIFALSQKSSHIPYRNSKLTQLLQSALGGQAKTLMFVQLNPDVNSFSETLSTLKFAERVSGVELGAARSTKEGRDVRELMEQVASLKDTISEKDEEIERLHILKDLKNGGTTAH
ncbi:kinesin-like protein KIN-14P [Senna tora]|uniref:Kinesin-like protein KIN-14P n=1 Tax=Senna tora TaxID=362788 RepID=A0A834SLW8_9FABA|nr:kinesin-like protein KIN-14P [Senna tora]